LQRLFSVGSQKERLTHPKRPEFIIAFAWMHPSITRKTSVLNLASPCVTLSRKTWQPNITRKLLPKVAQCFRKLNKLQETPKRYEPIRITHFTRPYALRLLRDARGHIQQQQQHGGLETWKNYKKSMTLG
tara:strand:- start:12 stop:401 length:390 start_codon:yes stop_codon:yes gene_type:complete